MKKMWFVWAFLVLILFVAGGLFVFGDDVLDAMNGDGDSAGDESVSSVGVVGVEILNENVEDQSGGGGGGASEDEEVVCSNFQQLQYSLRNFISQPECLVYGVGGCERVKAVCSVEAYNLDYEVGGVFAVRYSLLSGDEVVGYKIVEANIGARESSILIAEIVEDGVFEMGDMECVIDMESVPKKSLC